MNALSNFRVRAALVTAALAALLPVAQAADVPAAQVAAAAATTPAKKALVQKLLTLQQAGVEALARSLVEQPVGPMVQQVSMMIQTRVPPDKREALQKDLQGDLKKYMDAALPLVRDKAVAAAPLTIGTQLEQKFSEDELRQLIGWLESPVAKKYQQLLPDLQKALTDKLVADTRPLIEPKLRELDTSVGKHLAAVMPAAAASGAAAPPKP